MTPQQLTGYGMLALLFIGLTVYGLRTAGWRITVSVYAGIALLWVFIWTALDLIHSRS